jgi:hypothetical protein
MTEGMGLPVGQPDWAAEFGEAGGAALLTGVSTGVNRVVLRGAAVVPPDEFFRDFEEAAVRPLIDLASEGGLDPDGLGLLSDVIATAVAVRIAHHEQSLSREDVRDFLPHFVSFMNTFIRGCDPT